MRRNWTILIAGFGSIGQRHLRNLKALGLDQVILYRSGKSTLSTSELAEVPVFFDLDQALEQTHPDAVIVANPTSLHMSVALSAARAGCHIFLEKPISNTLEGVHELQSVVETQRLIVLIGFQFRFHPGLIQIKKWLDDNTIGTIYHVDVHWGEYLPGWHPWEDYHKSYSALPQLGGGVILTLCHPFDYLRWLIGEINMVSAQVSYGRLDIAAEQIADIHLKFALGASGHVHLNYLQRPHKHQIQIIGSEGTIFWDYDDIMPSFINVVTGKWKRSNVPPNFERNTMFLLEMENFLDSISGNAIVDCSLNDGIMALRIALAVKESAEKGCQIAL